MARSLNLIPGVQGVHVPALAWRETSAAIETLRDLRERDILRDGEVVLIISANNGDDRGHLNSFQTFRVGAVDCALSASEAWLPYHLPSQSLTWAPQI